MQENVRKQIKKAEEKKKRLRRLYSLIACFSILVAGVVFWRLMQPGIAMSGETYCGQEEHTHTEGCYGQEIVCGQEEGAGGHTHTDACYSQVRTDELICGQEESQGHVHNEGCYTQVLTCTLPEDENHTHNEGCYTQELTCGMEEGEGAHTHTEDCYATTRELTCGQEESQGHVHTEECCGTGTELTCGMEEHTHTLACYSNPEAVETEDQWTAAFADYQFTGQWGTDAAAIAKSQIGYTESTDNYRVNEDDSTDGYTRYADWAGDDIYGDWDTYFAAFVLNYAGVPADRFPVNTEDLGQWISDMNDWGYYTSDNTDIQPGDLVILNKEGQDREQQIGIGVISEVNRDEEGNAASIKVVEGNVDNSVAENEYSADSDDMVGYGLMSAAYNTYIGTDDGEPEEEPETVEEPGTAANSLQINEDSGSEEGQVDQRVTVNTFIIEGNVTETTTGHPLKVHVNATYSGANQQDETDIWIHLGTIPEGLSLVGFDENGQHNVVTGNENVILQLVEESGISYVHFQLPQGATIDFDLEFESENGIMPQSTEITIEADKEKTTIAGNPWDDSKDKASSGVTLKWTAENTWDPVVKKVNGEDDNTIAVHADEDKLSGILIYTITAVGNNHDDEGAIWTDHIEITDTLTLENGHMWFPSDAVLDAENGQVKTADGIVIANFTELQGGKVTALDWVTDDTGKRTGITYKLNIPNQNLSNEDLKDREQTNLKLEMRLDSQYLELTDNYYDVSSSNDIIRNHVDFTAVPYKNYDENSNSTDEVTTVPKVSDDRAEFKKEADKEFVQAGETITYTITFTNIGDHPIDTIDEDGNYYLVTDTLPKYLELTKEQIDALEKKDAEYDADTRTITWQPTTDEEIPAGKGFTLQFEVTVKDSNDQDMSDLENGDNIRNNVSYKDFSTHEDVDYAKVKITVDKTSDGADKVENGDFITYKIVIENESEIDAAESSVFTDTLPDGLEFQYVQFEQNGDHITQDGTYKIESNDDETYNVKFSEENGTLRWEVDPLKAGDRLVFYYTCKVDTDKIDGDRLENTIIGDNGEEDNDRVEVVPPIKLDKSVAQDTDTVYPNKSVFDYTITISNDPENPSHKEGFEVTDTLPQGMIPHGYTLIMTKDGTSSPVDWEDFTTGSIDNEAVYTTQINNDTVKVTRNGKRIVLTWTIEGEIPTSDPIVIKYQAQIILTDDQKEDGEVIDYKNTVEMGDLEDSVTVHGGEGCKLAFAKNIYYWADWDAWQLAAWNEDEDFQDSYGQMKQVSFVITGKDQKGNDIVFENGTTQLEIPFQRQFEYGADRFYEIEEKLEPGTYTIKELLPKVDDYTLTASEYRINSESHAKTYDDENGVQITVENGQTATVSLDNYYRESGEASVDIQKSVWGIGDWENQKLTYTSSKDIFAIDADPKGDKLVIYNITVVNTGKDAVTIYELTDNLPEGVSFVSVYNQNWNITNSIRDKMNEVQTNPWGGITTYSGNDQVESFVKKVSDGATGQVTFTLGNRANTEALQLETEQAVSFLMICKVDGSVADNVPLTNTATIKVDESVNYGDYPEIETQNTPYDDIQNNGTSQDEGVKDGYRYISSSVDITPSRELIPGITKDAVSYFNYTDQVDEETEIPEDKIIRSDSIVKWEIKLYNDGAVDLENYKVEDAVTDPFTLITSEQADKAGIEQRFTLQRYKFNNELDGRYTKDGQLLDVSDLCKEITGEDGKNSYQFIFEGSDYTISPGGYAVLTVYTYYNATNYQTYVNTATLYPEDDFNAVGVQDGHGELVRDENGEYSGVKSSAYVYALGDYGSVSWKEIEENVDPENWATGTPESGDLNYITVESSEDIVTYTNNIHNVSRASFHNMVVIDRLPGLNDRGVVNWQDERESEFVVSYIMDTMALTVEHEDGSSENVDPEEYTIDFSSIPVDQAYDSDDFYGNTGSGWHETWQEGDTSFRIVMDDEFQLAAGDTLVIRYNGKIAEDANPGQIAWNSFGYRYSVGDIYLTAEPPKVGVMIEADAIIRKVVVDPEGSELGADENVKFRFRLYHGETVDEESLLAEFDISQGGYVRLSDIKDINGNNISLQKGETYTLQEVLDPDSGYQLVGIGMDGGQLAPENYSFTYTGSTNLVIVARNKMEAYELPETGGFGTTGYLTGGAILMTSACLLGGYRMRRKRERREN